MEADLSEQDLKGLNAGWPSKSSFGPMNALHYRNRRTLGDLQNSSDKFRSSETKRKGESALQSQLLSLRPDEIT